MSPFACKNEPYMMTVYSDPDTMNDRVMIIVNLPSGCSNVKFSVNEDGKMATVKYSWPTAMFNPNILFKKFISNKTLSVFHPKVVAVAKELENRRNSVNEIPQGSIEILLPFQVQTEISSIEKVGVKSEDTLGQTSLVLIIELKSFQKKYSLSISTIKIGYEA